MLKNSSPNKDTLKFMSLAAGNMQLTERKRRYDRFLSAKYFILALGVFILSLLIQLSVGWYLVRLRGWGEIIAALHAAIFFLVLIFKPWRHAQAGFRAQVIFSSFAVTVFTVATIGEITDTSGWRILPNFIFVTAWLSGIMIGTGALVGVLFQKAHNCRGPQEASLSNTKFVAVIIAIAVLVVLSPWILHAWWMFNYNRTAIHWPE